MKAKSFVVEMGQGFRDVLPNALRELGGRVWSARLDESTTLVRVRVSFAAARTAASVQDALWDRWPSCSIGVSSTRKAGAR
jgi:hypothetical protein